MTSPLLRNAASAVPIVALLVTLAASPATSGGLVDPFVPLPWAPFGLQFAGQFGFTVAPAGDINGDGFSDVLVGAFGEDNTQSNEGRTHVFLGSAQGLATTPAIIHVTGQENAAGGLSIAPAGDVNGDGFADYLVGVPYWDTAAHSNAGKVMVFHGASDLDFQSADSLLSPAPEASQLFGRSVAPAGDVNGDGYDDVVVGSSNFAVGAFPNAGAAWVFHGGPTGLADLPERTWIGPPENGGFGSSVSTAGDVNGDGYADVIVGAPSASVGFAQNGAAHLYLGSASGAVAGADTVIVGTAASEFCGSSVANAGDTNGDGYADVLIGSPGFNANTGRCRLVHGGAFGLATGTILPNTDNSPNEFIGQLVATMGDLDGDGFADVGVRARYGGGGGRGRITVFRGGRAGMTIVGDILAPSGSGTFANSIATAGDTNGDGRSEILVGTEDWSTAPAWFEGKAFLYAAPRSMPRLNTGWPRVGAQAGTGYGTALTLLPHPTGATYPKLVIGDPGYNSMGRISFHNGGIFSGISPGEGGGAIPGFVNFQNRGMRLADVGDVNRDGYTDLISSSPTLDEGPISQAGRVDFHPGSITNLTEPISFVAGTHDFDRVGSALAGRGDVDGDGYHDILVGAREWDSASLENCGKAWLFRGSAAGPAASPWTQEGSSAGVGLGASVALIDLDGDGYSDVVIGSSAPPNGVSPPEGRVHVFYGGPGGVSTSPGLVLGSLDADVSFGLVVSAIGDVNGDQIADLAVGAPLKDGVGKVYVYAGTRGRSQTRKAIRIYTGTQANARFGAAITGGGDVDADGFGDFAIGSPLFDSGVADDGRIDLYRGATELPSAAPFFTYTTGIAGSRLGESFAPIADANHDGFADLVVGAPGAAGRVYPFMGGGGPGHMSTLTLYEVNVANKRRVHPARLDDEDQVRTEMFYASPGGRANIGIEFEVVEQNTAFTGVPGQSTGLVYDSGEPDDGAGLLSSVIRVFPAVNLPWPGRGYHLRSRFVTRSPFFPRSRWMTPEAHTSGDLDVWTSGAVVDAVPPGGAVRPGLHGVAPNPSAAGGLARLSFALAQPGRAVLDLHDVRGALVRRLLDEDRPAGPSSVAWDGRDDNGRAVPAGLYFARFAGDGGTTSARLVRLP